jgi:hypothetical protein
MVASLSIGSEADLPSFAAVFGARGGELLGVGGAGGAAGYGGNGGQVN